MPIEASPDDSHGNRILNRFENTNIDPTTARMNRLNELQFGLETRPEITEIPEELKKIGIKLLDTVDVRGKHFMQLFSVMQIPIGGGKPFSFPDSADQKIVFIEKTGEATGGLDKIYTITHQDGSTSRLSYSTDGPAGITIQTNHGELRYYRNINMPQ